MKERRFTACVLFVPQFYRIFEERQKKMVFIIYCILGEYGCKVLVCVCVRMCAYVCVGEDGVAITLWTSSRFARCCFYWLLFLSFLIASTRLIFKNSITLISCCWDSGRIPGKRISSGKSHSCFL